MTLMLIKSHLLFFISFSECVWGGQNIRYAIITNQVYKAISEDLDIPVLTILNMKKFAKYTTVKNLL